MTRARFYPPRAHFLAVVPDEPRVPCLVVFRERSSLEHETQSTFVAGYCVIFDFGFVSSVLTSLLCSVGEGRHKLCRSVAIMML